MLSVQGQTRDWPVIIRIPSTPTKINASDEGDLLINDQCFLMMRIEKRGFGARHESMVGMSNHFDILLQRTFRSQSHFAVPTIQSNDLNNIFEDHHVNTYAFFLGEFSCTSTETCPLTRLTARLPSNSSSLIEPSSHGRTSKISGESHQSVIKISSFAARIPFATAAMYDWPLTNLEWERRSDQGKATRTTSRIRLISDVCSPTIARIAADVWVRTNWRDLELWANSWVSLERNTLTRDLYRLPCRIWWSSNVEDSWSEWHCSFLSSWIHLLWSMLDRRALEIPQWPNSDWCRPRKNLWERTISDRDEICICHRETELEWRSIGHESRRSIVSRSRLLWHSMIIRAQRTMDSLRGILSSQVNQWHVPTFVSDNIESYHADVLAKLWMLQDLIQIVLKGFLLR